MLMFFYNRNNSITENTLKITNSSKYNELYDTILGLNVKLQSCKIDTTKKEKHVIKYLGSQLKTLI